MAAVFIMQPIGQLVAWAVGMAALQGLSRDYNLEVGVLTTNPDEIDDAKIGIDIFWRIVVGVRAVPALIAILFRWTIPESGRYTYDVKQDARTALKDTRKVYEQQTAMQSEGTELSDLTLEAAKDVGPRRPTKPLPAQQIKKLLDSRHEREVLDGLRRVIAVRTSQMPPWEELC